MRLSVTAHPERGDQTEAAAIQVEYGRVEIGQRFYMCPLHGIAISKVRIQAAHQTNPNQPAAFQTQINDVVFEQYHVFRGDPRVLLEKAAP